jgi:hypothetical protein
LSTSLIVIGKAALGEALAVLAIEGLRVIDYRLDSYVRSMRKRKVGEINDSSGCNQEKGQDLRKLN